LPGIDLYNDWNLFGYPLVESQPVSDALQSIDDFYALVLGYDAQATVNPWQAYNPNWPPVLNDLLELAFGRGYWIKITSTVTVTLSSAQVVDLAQQAAAASIAMPPATYWGLVNAADGFTPAAGLRVDGLIDGVLCGTGSTVAAGGQVFYKLHVLAAEGGGPVGCGTPSSTVTIRVDGRAGSEAVPWDRDVIRRVDLGTRINLYLPFIDSQGETEHSGTTVPETERESIYLPSVNQ
jgi:hypothetical protein